MFCIIFNINIYILHHILHCAFCSSPVVRLHHTSIKLGGSLQRSHPQCLVVHGEASVENNPEKKRSIK